MTPRGGAVGKIVLTGVIGDCGTAKSVNKDRTVANGEYLQAFGVKGWPHPMSSEI